MKVIVARTAGFCMGVRRALALALAAAEERGSPLYTYGPLIHNRHVVEHLERLGIKVIEQAAGVTGARVLIRAHGAPLADICEFSARGIEIIDATCPKVTLSERFVERQAAAGRNIVIVGDRGHAEVTALASRAQPQPVHIISNAEEAGGADIASPIAVVAQTTFDAERYRAILETLRARFADVVHLDSVCLATEERQAELRQLAAAADAIIVVGDRQSANTRRLVEIANQCGAQVYHVESADELPAGKLAGVHRVAVTAGASTPAWITGEVVAALRSAGSPLRRLLAPLAACGAPVMLLGLAAAAATQILLRRFSLLASIYAAAMLPAAYSYNRYMTGRWPLRRLPGASGRWLLAAVAVAGGMAVMTAAAALWRGWLAAGSLMLLALAGSLAYPLKLIPAGRRRLGLQDIPAAKDLSVVAAWLAVTWLLPCLLATGTVPLAALPVAFPIALLGFAQSVYADIRNLEDDRLLGRETLVSLLGARALRLLLVAATALAVAGAVVSYLLVSAG